VLRPAQEPIVKLLLRAATGIDCVFGLGLLD
jgi:hypothetical protein